MHAKPLLQGIQQLKMKICVQIVYLNNILYICKKILTFKKNYPPVTVEVQYG